jgi:flagellar motor switch/type III secretory pathway protein FliN
MQPARSLSTDGAERSEQPNPAVDGAVPLSLHELSSQAHDAAESTKKVLLRFGTCQVSEEAAAYVAGQTVVLMENVDAPVEIVMDHRVVAVGQLVTQDGKLGIQITQVMTRAEDSHAA